MDLELTDDQVLFLETTRKFLDTHSPVATVRALCTDPLGFDRRVLSQGAELGWTSMLIPEELGGGSVSGEGVRDLFIVAEELGRCLLPGPVLATNIVAFALASGGSERLAKEHLPQIAAGQELATWTGPARDVEVTIVDGDCVIGGVAGPVLDGHAVDQVLVSPTRDGCPHVLVPTDASGVSVETLDGLDVTRRYCRLRFDQVRVPASAIVGTEGSTAPPTDRLLALALALQCAETVGATEAVLSMTLDYVKSRNAFGRPIGSYQALKHRLADMLLWLESSKAATGAALAAVEKDSHALPAARVAKAYVADRCPAIVRDCLQMHGGIGYTWEHDLHLFLRRVETNAAVYGGVDEQCDALAASIGLAGGSR